MLNTIILKNCHAHEISPFSELFILQRVMGECGASHRGLRPQDTAFRNAYNLEMIIRLYPISLDWRRKPEHPEETSEPHTNSTHKERRLESLTTLHI